MTSGNGHANLLTFSHAPRRVVSMVPSVTESLIELGAGESLVGVTDFCEIPPSMANLARVGGTKSAGVEQIVALAPELVIANQEENTRAVVEALERAGLKVWVTFPRSVDDALSLLWTLVRLFRLPQSAPKVKTIEVTLDWTSRASGGRDPVRVFCPVWQGTTAAGRRWWMTFNAGTYCHDVLARCGGRNVFADRERKYPLEADLGEQPPEDAGGKDIRYPRVTVEEVRQLDPQCILLPQEPFAFDEADRDQIRKSLGDTAAVQADRVHIVDGRLLPWHGTHLARSLAELPGLLQLP